MKDIDDISTIEHSERQSAVNIFGGQGMLSIETAIEFKAYFESKSRDSDAGSTQFIARAIPPGWMWTTFQNLEYAVREANKSLGFNLGDLLRHNDILSPAVLINRALPPDDGVPWHTDYTSTAGSPSKLVMVVQLSDPAEYTGGILEVFDGQTVWRVSREFGSFVIFPSFFVHRRLPVESGTRYILGVQARGQPFR